MLRIKQTEWGTGHVRVSISLTDREAGVMQVLWVRGPSVVSDVQGADSPRPWPEYSVGAWDAMPLMH